MMYCAHVGFSTHLHLKWKRAERGSVRRFWFITHGKVTLMRLSSTLSFGIKSVVHQCNTENMRESMELRHKDSTSPPKFKIARCSGLSPRDHVLGLWRTKNHEILGVNKNCQHRLIHGDFKYAGSFTMRPARKKCYSSSQQCSSLHEPRDSGCHKGIPRALARFLLLSKILTIWHISFSEASRTLERKSIERWCRKLSCCALMVKSKTILNFRWHDADTYCSLAHFWRLMWWSHARI